MRLERKQLLVVALWYLLLIAAYLVYQPGINDRFYFDDYANLPALGATGEVDNLDKLKIYLQSNSSGPTGRPLSVLSFLIDDNTWPSDARKFKKTNLLIHLVIACLVFWASLLIVSALKIKRPGLYLPWWSALLVAAFWLLNPLHVSTVLYPVQRMAQLAALFTVAAIVAFLKLRPLLQERPYTGAGYLVLTVLPLYLMAIFSKENGVLLPFFLLILEIFVLRSVYPIKKHLYTFFKTAVWLSVLSVVGIILFKAGSNGWLDPYPGRDFSPLERLLTQPTVILVYLRELFLPGLYTSALYYDDFRHLTFSDYYQVIGTTVVVLFLIIYSFLSIKRTNVAAFGIAFFFAGHILESTALNLELIFEHRNYLPSFFLGFCLIPIISLIKKTRIPAFIVPVLVLLVYPATTMSRVHLWGDPLEFGGVLAKLSPHSVRSQVELNNALVSKGLISQARSHMKEATANNPDSLYLALHMVLLDCMANEHKTSSYDTLIKLAKRRSFDGRNRLAIETLWRFMEESRCEKVTPSYFNELIKAFHEGEKIGQTQGEVSKRGLRIIAQRFYLQYPEFAPGKVQPLKEVLKSQNPEYLMLNAANMASLGRYHEALMLSDRARELVSQGIIGTSRRSPENFLEEIDRFAEIVESDLEEES